MSQQNKQTYLVTGAAGFIGSQFVQSCLDRKIQVISVDSPAHFSSRTEHHKTDFGKTVDRADLWDWIENLGSPLSQHIHAIVHLGAITDTRESDPKRLAQWNLEYSKRLWQIATDQGLPFIYASSAATYGDGALGYNDQEDLIPKLRPLNLYGQSKQDFDLWALGEEKKSNSCPPSWAGFKFFNVFGPGERHKGFMSSVVLHSFDQIRKNGGVTLFKSHRPGIADGFQKRDFVYVRDVVNVLHFALDRPIKRGIYNLGTGKARAFLELAQAVFTVLDKPEQIHFVDTPVEIRDKYQYFTEAVMDRLREQGYTAPFTSLEEGIQDYVKKLLQI